MFKSKVLIALSMGLVVMALVAGCGQEIPSIDIQSGQPTGLVVTGKVFQSKMSWDTWGYSTSTIDLNKPLQGVTVALIGPAQFSAITNADGSYKFENVAAGSYTVTASLEGYQTGSTSGSFNSQLNVTENSVLTMSNVGLLVNPIIASVIVSASNVQVNFNKPVNPNSVLATLSFNGYRTAGNATLDKTWDAEEKQLTLTPRDGFASGGLYKLYISGQNGYYYGIMDKDGNALSLNGYATESNKIYVNINSDATGAIPTAPINLAAKATSTSTTSNIDYTNVNYAYSPDGVFLSWDAVSGATSYNLYASYNSGPYQLVGNYINNNSGDGVLTPNKIDEILSDLSRIGGANSNYLTEFDPFLPWPYLGLGIDFKVTAVNGVGESPYSASLNVKDNVAPTIISAIRNTDTQIRVNFNEPLPKAVAENAANYRIAGQTVSSATLANDADLTGGIGAMVTLTITPGAATGTVTAESAVTDLTGNAVDATVNSASW